MKRKPAPWPRWAKVTRNLVLFLFLALTVWTQLGRPLPYEAALRRTARQYLVPELDHCVDVSRGFWGDAIRVDCTEGAAMLSLPPARSTTFTCEAPRTEVYRLTEGANLLIAPWSVLQPSGGTGSDIMEVRAAYIAVFPPEESVRAALTLHNGSRTFTADAVKGSGVYVFLLEPEQDANGAYSIGPSWYADGGYTYELEFYDLAGDKISKMDSSWFFTREFTYELEFSPAAG